MPFVSDVVGDLTRNVIRQQQERQQERQNMPAVNDRSLAQRFRQRADELQARPYVPYGAGAKQKAAELLARSKRGKRVAGRDWNLQHFSDDDLRLIISDPTYAAQVLKNFDPAFTTANPTERQILNFRKLVAHNEGQRVYPEFEGEFFPHHMPNASQVGQAGMITRQEASKARELLEARIAESQNLERQAQTTLHRADRIAPLSPLHETARSLIQGNDPRESLNVGREEIEAARRTNIPRAMATYLAKASQEPENYMTQYMERYKPLIKNFREEARKDFLQHDLPSINNQFASRGAFYSSAREAAIRKAMREKDARITREIRNLHVHGQEQAMKDLNAARGHHLRQAEVVGSAQGAQREANIRAAEAMRINALSGSEAARQRAADLSHMGHIEQRQEQHQRDVQQQEHEREQRYPQEQAILEATILGQVPPGSFQMNLSPPSVNPPPPNPLSALGGAFAQMAGLNMQPQQQQRSYAKGGHVRQGYAAGDSVKRAAAQLAEMRNHTEKLPEEIEMRQRSQGFNDYRAHPMGDYLFSLGTHMLGNLREDPMKVYSEGSNLGMQAFKAAHAHNLSLKEKEDNTLDKINQTKLYQQQLFSKHHDSMLQQEEMLRHHQSQEAESRRAHDIMQAHYKAKDNASLMGPVKMSATERRLVNDAKKSLLRSNTMDKEIEKINELLSKTTTGPISGGIKSIFPKTKIDNQIKVATEKFIFDMHQNMANLPRAEAIIKRLETTKPNINNHPEANKLALELMQNAASDAREHSISTLLDAGWTPEKIKKQFKIKIPQHFLEEESGEGVEESTPTSNNIINMIDPEGNPLSVPQDQVKEAESLGATIVQ